MRKALAEGWREFHIPLGDDRRARVLVEVDEDVSLPAPQEVPLWVAAVVRDVDVFAAISALRMARCLGDYEAEAGGRMTEIG